MLITAFTMMFRRVRCDLTDEGLIDLEGINGKLSKVTQAGVPRAEVIEPPPVTLWLSVP